MAGLTSNLPMFCSSLTLLPERYCQARPRSEGGIPFWHRSRICRRDTAVTGKSRSTGKQRDSWGKVGARPAPWPQAGPLLLPEKGQVSLSPWDAGMPAGMAVKAAPAARGSCQGPSRSFVACKQLQTSLALPQSQILPGAGKANIGAEVGSGWLCPHGKHWGHEGGSPAPSPAPHSSVGPWKAGMCTLTSVSAFPLAHPGQKGRSGPISMHGQILRPLGPAPCPQFPVPLVSLALGTSQDQSPAEAVGTYPVRGAEPA